MGVILNGRELSDKILAQVAVEVKSLKQNGITPKLCVILVGDNPASLSYVNMKHRACERTGIESQVLKFGDDISQSTLLSEIERLNNDKGVSGILVQLPLPKHIGTDKILEAIEPKKDVDGFHPYNVGRLVAQSMSDSSKSDSSDSSLRGRIADSHEAIQSYRHSELSQESEESKKNGKRFVDSLRCRAQNDESFVDCHDSANAKSRNDEYNKNANSSIVSEKSGLCSHERGNKTNSLLTKRTTSLHDLSPQDEFATILAPATPLGVMQLLKSYNIEVSGKNVAIIGASNIVGKPLSALMLNAGATISLCHILTKDISVFTKSADIVCVGVGKANLITADKIKDGAIVVDIGINKVNGKITGDVDFENVAKKASFITPVPGGVGPMTIAMLLKNTLLCARILSEPNK